MLDRFQMNVLAQKIADRTREVENSKALPKGPQADLSAAQLAKKIDHTLLKPDTTPGQLDKLCDEAMKHHFATCCVNSANIAYISKRLQGSDVLPIAAIGFPLGAILTEAKVAEAAKAVQNGAQEIDMVIHVGALKDKRYEELFADIAAVAKACSGKKLKVIIETCLLTQEEKIAACVIAQEAGAAFVKTSTGFSSGGATPEDVALMRQVVGNKMEVKASGGIRTQEDALTMIAAGADRVGASASVSIVEGKKGAQGY